MRLLFSLLASGLLLLTNSALLSSARHTRDLPFDALAFRRQVVTCPAVNRALNQTVDLHLRTYLKSRSITSSSAQNRHCSLGYVDINPSSKRTLLLLHGWPSLWASWKYQIQEFRVIHCRLGTLHYLIHNGACRAAIGLLFPIFVGLAHQRIQGMFNRLAHFPTWSET